jgi:predicted metal-dependent peptidase
MPKITDRGAWEKMVRARTNLLVNNGFFGFLAMQLRMVEATEIGGHPINTGAVDGVNLYYNPEFVNQLDEREAEFLVAHEVLHCCFKHFLRRGPRQPAPWNAATDYAINLDLKEAGFKLIHDRQISGKKFKCCIDDKYKNMTAEEIYESFPKITIQMLVAAGNGDPGGCGEVLDTPGGAEGEEITKQAWETAVRSAVHQAKLSNAGNIPGSLKHLIDELDKPKISWRDKTRNFIDQSLTKDISWSRLSRRSVSIGALLPGTISDRLSQLIFIVDTSGSINFELLKSFLSEVAGALDEGTADQMTVLYADTRVHDIDYYMPGDLVTARQLPNGGGGTDFEDSFKWVKENAPDASCVIYLTDLQVSNFGEEPLCPVLWAVYSPDTLYDQLAAQAPFGNCIQVSNQYG